MCDQTFLSSTVYLESRSVLSDLNKKEGRVGNQTAKNKVRITISVAGKIRFYLDYIGDPDFSY